MENILYFYLVISLCFTVFESIYRVVWFMRHLGNLGNAKIPFWLATARWFVTVFWFVTSFIRDLIINPLIMPQLTFNYVTKALKMRQ
jgi:hypothetical protein